MRSKGKSSALSKLTLSGDNASNDAPARLHDDIEQTRELRWPIPHEVPSEDHGAVSAQRPKSCHVGRSGARQSVGENGDADAIHPPESEDQRAQEAEDEVDNAQRHAKPEREHLNVSG